MAEGTNQEEVVYSYTGDVSSLRSATQEAIGLLTKYEKRVKTLTDTGNVNVGKTAFTGFRRSLNGVVKQTNQLVKLVDSVSDGAKDIKLPDTKGVVSANKDIADVLDYVDRSTKITTEDVKLMTDVLKDAQSALRSFVNKATPAAASFATLAKLKPLKPTPTPTSESPFELPKAGTSISMSASISDVSFSKPLEIPHIPDMTSETLQSLRRIEEASKASTNSIKQDIYKMLESVSPAVAAKLQSLESKMRQTLGPVSKKVAEISAAFRRVGTSGDDAGGSVKRLSKQHKALQQIVQKLKGSMRGETREIGSEDKALSSKNKTISLSTKLHKGLSSVLGSLGSIFRRESAGVFNLGRGFGRLNNSMLPVRRVMAALVGIPMARWLAQSIKSSIHYTETLNLFEVATAGATKEAKAFVDQMQEVYGMDPNNIMRYIGNYRQLADAIDMPEAAATKLSLGLTKATNDIASLFNMPIEQVFENLSSGMQGMSRAVRKYGMDIRATTLEQTALSLGIERNVEDMSEADRQGLRYITMMRQASNAVKQVTTDVNGNTVVMGDFAKTIESPANQLRIFKEQMIQLGRAIGNFFIAPLSKAIQYINGFVMALRMVITYIGSLFGILAPTTKSVSDTASAAKSAAGAIGGIGSAAGGASKKLKELRKTLAPFDELNLLQAPDTDDGGSGGGGGGGSLDSLMDPAIAKEIEDMQIKLENIRMKANQVRDALLEFFGFKIDAGEIISWDASAFEANLIGKFPQWTKTIEAVFDNWSDIVNGFKKVFRSLIDVAAAVKKKVLDALHIDDDSVSTFIGGLADNLDRLSDWISAHADSIANLVVAFGAFKLLQPLLPILGNLFGWLTQVGGALQQVAAAFVALSAPVQAAIALIALVAFTLVDLWNTSDSFRGAVGKAWSSLVDLLSTLWNKLLKPIIDEVAKVLVHLYQETIKPLIEKISKIVLTLWSDILKPLLSWIVTALGPPIADVAKFILGVVDWLFENVGNVLEGLLTAIQGVIDFVAGVFTGDWERAWHGILNILIGILNAVVSVVQGILNVIISAVNGVISIVWNGVVGLINLVLGAVNQLGSIFGQEWSLQITAGAPQIPYANFSIPEVPMATGGVVTGPTHALIGEGRYDEAVVPLGNSPQMREFVDQIASRSQDTEQVRLLREQNELLREILNKTGTVNIDGRSLSDSISRYQRQSARARGL